MVFSGFPRLCSVGFFGQVFRLKITRFFLVFFCILGITLTALGISGCVLRTMNIKLPRGDGDIRFQSNKRCNLQIAVMVNELCIHCDKKQVPRCKANTAHCIMTENLLPVFSTVCFLPDERKALCKKRIPCVASGRMRGENAWHPRECVASGRMRGVREDLTKCKLYT
jgi:hypothetical protein